MKIFSGFFIWFHCLLLLYRVRDEIGWKGGGEKSLDDVKNAFGVLEKCRTTLARCFKFTIEDKACVENLLLRRK